ncbi:hypothetical protein KP509_21G068300 [Ceratopteris richardii]|uniref:Uncharacterized protein n=1 Tax=Ceratopteris richardii TaxID=49495 RepID=A0A8T2SAY6_CERRI|nr:hypothetical protein KP509_21G068300 [Ceratopteris richardii]
MNVFGARVSLASAWSGHGNSQLPASPRVHHPSLQAAKSVVRTCELPAVVEKSRNDFFSSEEQAFHGSFGRESVHRGARLIVSASSVAQSFSGVDEEDAVQEPVIVPGTNVNSIREWELDFCSRPILDERGKRVWELLICDSGRKLQFAKYYPNNVINSLTLKSAILSVIQLGLPKPQKVRFFRSQMTNIVTKACTELDIQAVPSRRCFSLIRWLDERYDSVYRKHPGFQANAPPLMQLEESFPAELPDNLRGEQWAFVQLPISGLMEEVAAVEQGDSFGSVFPLGVLGLDLPSNAVIPGVAVASARATPLAAWTNALELGCIKVDKPNKRLILTTGCLDQWIYAYYRRSRQSDQEADAWEASKRACGGLHFLAVQKSLDSDVCTGFWLLYDGPQCRI